MATPRQGPIERQLAAILAGRVRRREFIGLLGAAAASRSVIAFAQIPTKRPLIAVLIVPSQATSQRYRSAFTERLQELGYVERRDYEIEYRYADGDLTRLPALADELIRLKPKVIVASSSADALAAKQGTASIPIVAAAFGPARPGNGG